MRAAGNAASGSVSVSTARYLIEKWSMTITDTRKPAIVTIQAEDPISPARRTGQLSDGSLIAPMPAMPDVPGTDDQPKPQPRSQVDAAPREAVAAGAGAGADVTLVDGNTPLRRSTTDAMCQVVCFLSAKSQNVQYLPPSQAFRELFARKIAG